MKNWEEIHKRYDTLWKTYPLEKQKHAFATLCTILEIDEPTKEQWITALDKAVEVQEYIRDQIYISRKKDFDNPFRQATYRNREEMNAAIGTIDDNSFITQVRVETKDFKKFVDTIKNRN